jgi:hypothetical protein
MLTNRRGYGELGLTVNLTGKRGLRGVKLADRIARLWRSTARASEGQTATVAGPPDFKRHITDLHRAGFSESSP